MLLALAVGAAVSTEALAQGNQYQQQIANQINQAATLVKSQGYSPDRAPMMGSLNDDAEESIMVNLNAGTRYAFVGVCDNDCTDVDLQLFGGDGTKIAEDLDTDDKPVLQFTATYTGAHRMKVLMPTCNQNPCYYGVQIFVK
jgi:hypothetical protein